MADEREQVGEETEEKPKTLIQQIREKADELIRRAEEAIRRAREETKRINNDPRVR